MNMTGKGMQELTPELDMLRSHNILVKRHHRQPEMTDDLLYAVGDHASSMIIKDKCVPTDHNQVYELLTGAMNSALEERLEKRPDYRTSETCVGILLKNKSQLLTVCSLSGFYPPGRPGIAGDSRRIMPPITEHMFVKMARRKMERKHNMDLKNGTLFAGGVREHFQLLNEYRGVVGFVKYKPNNAMYSGHLALHVNNAVWRMNNYERYNDALIKKFVVIGEGYEACRMYDATYGDILADQKVSLYLLSREKGLRGLN